MTAKAPWLVEDRLPYEVPLYSNNQFPAYRTISTGLVKVHPDGFTESFANWWNARTQSWLPALPPMASWPALNGCPLSNSVHRTYYIGEVGEYFLQSTSIGVNSACSTFNIKMQCSGGAETASPEDSNPLGFSVDVKTGAITGTPENVRDGYKMQLKAVDASDTRSTVAEWNFNVEAPPAFALKPSAGWSTETDGKLASKYHVSETHLLPKPRVKTEELLEHPAGGDFSKVIYLLSAERASGDNSKDCTIPDADENTKVISAMMDVSDGEGAINIKCEGNYTAKLVVRDGAGDEVTLRSWHFMVLPVDTDVPSYGPNGRSCENGDAVDGEAMDGSFTCDCDDRYAGPACEFSDSQTCSGSGTAQADGSCICDADYSGTNCEEATAAAAAATAAAAAAAEKTSVSLGVGLGLFVILLVVLGVYKLNSGKHRRRRLALARKVAEPGYGATQEELSDGLLAAVELGELGLVPTLIKVGADASIRGASGGLRYRSV